MSEPRLRSAFPRPLAAAVARVAGELAPATPLAAVQRAWPGLVGEAIAREAQPTAERDGVLTVGCRSSVWAHELQLMAPGLVERLNEAVSGARLRSLRCVALPPPAVP